MSTFTRSNYSYKNRYSISGAIRIDGSSKFARGHRWGIFPSGAVSWNIGNEPFIKRVKAINQLKLRYSFGAAGNNRIPAGSTYPAYGLASNTSKSPFFNEQREFMLEHKSVLYNPNLKWETTITRNLGIDYGFFRGRINGSLDLYWNTTKDLLMLARVQSNAGRTYQYQNFGQTSNKGIEFSTNIVAVEKKNFTLNANFNIAWNSNKIDKLTTDDPWQSSSFAGSTFGEYNDYYLTEGGRLGEVWGYKMNGYYKTATFDANGNFTGQAGDLRLVGTSWYPVDANGNAITNTESYPDKSYTKTGGVLYPGGPKFQTDEDGNPIKQKLGNTIPTVTGGFGIDGQYRMKFGTIDFNVFCNYSLGNKILNGTKAATAFYAGSSANYNLNADFNIDNRYSWIDPVTGLNLGRPSDNTVGSDYYPTNMAIMNRLAEINNGKEMYNPAAASTMPIPW